VPDNRQFAASSAVALVAKMTNSHEALRQDMHQESPHKLLAIQPLGLQSGMIPIVLIAEGDSVILHRQQTPITDGDSVSVAIQIIHYALGLVQAVSGVNNPLLLDQVVEHTINLTFAGLEEQDSGHVKNASSLLMIQ
jgi:hypothetical protein